MTEFKLSEEDKKPGIIKKIYRNYINLYDKPYRTAFEEIITIGLMCVTFLTLIPFIFLIFCVLLKKIFVPTSVEFFNTLILVLKYLPYWIGFWFVFMIGGFLLLGCDTSYTKEKDYVRYKAIMDGDNLDKELAKFEKKAAKEIKIWKKEWRID